MASQDVETIARGVMQLARRMRMAHGDGAVSSSALALLATLHRLGAMPAARLAEAEGLQPQSLSRLLASLFDAGLIVRETDEADRRNLIIHLTVDGAHALKADIDARRAWLEIAMAERLSVDERAALTGAAQLMLRLADPPRSKAPRQKIPRFEV